MQFSLHVRLTELCNTKKNQFRLDFPLCSHNDMIQKKSENVHFQLYFSTLTFIISFCTPFDLKIGLNENVSDFMYAPDKSI